MSKNSSARIEQKFVVEHFISEVKEALLNDSTQLSTEQKREEDEAELHENIMSILFPNEDETTVLKRELANLTSEDYLETLKDKKFPNKSETRVFAKKYDEDYIFLHVRMETLVQSESDETVKALIMSLHFRDEDDDEIEIADFPYKEVEENELGKVE